MFGPCDWPIQYRECASGEENDNPLPEAIADLSVTQRDRVESMALEFLWNWTGRGFGLCEVSLRPCRADCFRPSTYQGPRFASGVQVAPLSGGGYWANYGCGCISTRHGCSCGTGPSSFLLPGPVSSVEEILIDGVVLPRENYRVDNYNLLVHTGGRNWPSCQDTTAAPTESGTWQVTYTKGMPVPVGGQVAAGVLAEEMAKALCNDGSCQLPERVQTVTRQGVTMAMIDLMEDMDKGRTGIWLIDSWVSSVTAPRARSAVYSPDIPRARNRVTTWT